ncbi:MAG: polysaccharide pyruvyl transferase family protein [Opitutaceae bacterium]
MFGLRTSHKELVDRIINRLIEGGAQVLLIPHVFGTGPNSESDVNASREVLASLAPTLTPYLTMVSGDFDQHELKAIIGSCSFFIGARMHACIAALSQTIPAVGLAYSPKFRGVFNSVGLSDQVLDLRSAETQEIVARILDAFRNRANLHRLLIENVPGVRRRVLSFFDHLTEPVLDTPVAR